MLPELGQILLLCALLASLLQAGLPLVGAQRGNAAWMAVARPAAFAQLLLVAGAFAVLTAAFVQQDFSVRYVAENSNSLLPLIYRSSAVWGAHEGSLLMWALVLALWTGAVALFSRHLPAPAQARVLAVVGVVSDRVGVMYRGVLVEVARTADLFRRPRHPYTAQLLAAAPRHGAPLPPEPAPSQVSRAAEGCVFASLCAHMTSGSHNRQPGLSEVGPAHQSACLRTELHLGSV